MAGWLPLASVSTFISLIPILLPTGSLGAVIILLTWFYITGLMLLLGAEINSEIEAASAEMRLGLHAPAGSGPGKRNNGAVRRFAVPGLPNSQIPNARTGYTA